jgi:hypothetical protein
LENLVFFGKFGIFGKMWDFLENVGFGIERPGTGSLYCITLW